jgi:hypothetical protein
MGYLLCGMSRTSELTMSLGHTQYQVASQIYSVTDHVMPRDREHLIEKRQ